MHICGTVLGVTRARTPRQNSTTLGSLAAQNWRSRAKQNKTEPHAMWGRFVCGVLEKTQAGISLTIGVALFRMRFLVSLTRGNETFWSHNWKHWWGTLLLEYSAVCTVLKMSAANYVLNYLLAWRTIRQIKKEAFPLLSLQWYTCTASRI